MLRAKCKPGVKGMREVAAVVKSKFFVLELPLHVVEQRFHLVKGKQKCPHGRTVVTFLAAENSLYFVASKGKPLFVYGEGWQLAPQWCS